MCPFCFAFYSQIIISRSSFNEFLRIYKNNLIDFEIIITDNKILQIINNFLMWLTLCLHRRFSLIYLIRVKLRNSSLIKNIALITISCMWYIYIFVLEFKLWRSSNNNNRFLARNVALMTIIYLCFVITNT